jgi:hypothetical protein
VDELDVLQEIMPKESQRRWGCLTIGLMLVLGVVAVNTAANWWSERPRQMLSRFLDVKWSQKITKLETDFIGGMDFAAHIYLEADAATVGSILAKGNFAKSSTQSGSRSITRLNFDGAPDAGAEPLIHYYKDEGSVLEYVAVTPDGLRLWYAAYDY